MRAHTLLASFCVVFLTSFVVFMCVGFSMNAKCMRHGYPRTDITLDGWYCIRLINQSQEVVRADSF